MKHGIYYAYWETEWAADYVPYVKKVAGLGFDILEVGGAALPGMTDAQLKELKNTLMSSTKTKLAAAMIKNDLNGMKKLLDPSEIGGTPFLGISKPVIKAHGSSDARAICNAVLRAKEFAESGFIADVERDIELMKLSPVREKVEDPS